MDSPQQFARYGGHRWGITVGDGLGAHKIKMSGIVMASPLLDPVATALMAAARKRGV
jgi:hypothetical protein